MNSELSCESGLNRMELVEWISVLLCLVNVGLVYVKLKL